jgi:hypothetical protein
MRRTSVPVTRLFVAALLGLGLLVACGDDEPTAAPQPPVSAPAISSTPAVEQPPPPGAVDAVLYTIHLSTDPYGGSPRARGAGALSGLATGRIARTEVLVRSIGGWAVSWLPDGRIVVIRKTPPFRPPLLFRYVGDELERAGAASLGPQEWRAFWSPDGALLATEPAREVDCGEGTRPGLHCWRDSGVVYVARVDGSGRRAVTGGHLGGWTPDGRLLVTDDRYLEYSALDVQTGESNAVVPPAAVAQLAGLPRSSVGKPVWSADGRYIAAYVDGAWTKRSKVVNAFVIATADGRPLNLVTSPYIVSMLAWSPAGHALAYTTSGFPDPHELFVLDEPGGKPRRLFATADRHFDWITWSPDGRFLLVDDEHASRRGRWLLIDAKSGRIVRRLPRPGGAPQWCCPANAYVTVNG